MLPWYLGDGIRKEQRVTPDGQLEWGYCYNDVPDYMLHDLHGPDYSDLLAKEKEPRTRIEVYPIWKLLKSQEKSIAHGSRGIPWPREEAQSSKERYKGPLSPASFPSPWPTIPFSYRSRRLKYLIPLQVLPSKITVHDPWNLLAVDSHNIYGTAQSHIKGDLSEGSWIKKRDKVHQYRLQIFDEKLRNARETTDVADMWQTSDALEKLSLFKLRPTVTARWSYEEGGFCSPQLFYLDEEVPLYPSTGLLVHPPTSEPSCFGPIPPPVYVILPPPPASIPEQENINNIGPLGDETHLYFTPTKISGTGHHSMAYKVEWEIPRSTVFPSSKDGYTLGPRLGTSTHILCLQCVMYDAQAQLLAESNDEYWTKRRGLKTGDLMGTLQKVEASNHTSGQPGPSQFAEDFYQQGVQGGNKSPETYEYQGPLRFLRTTVRYQHRLRPACPHFSPLLASPPSPPTSYQPPPTVKVRVLAKLSMDAIPGHDNPAHMMREVRCYERFNQAEEGSDRQRELWSHWGTVDDSTPRMAVHAISPAAGPFGDDDSTSYLDGVSECQDKREGVECDASQNGTDEMDRPRAAQETAADIQLGAIVPRYYGFWVHDESCTCGQSGIDQGYFSDILLIEDCGSSIEDEDLTSEEKDEVINLFRRFHSLGWTHGSPYTRNVVWQYGPINRRAEDREKDKLDRQMSFRLIDFGRSTYHVGFDVEDKTGEGEGDMARNSKRKRWESECGKEDWVVKKECQNINGSIRVLVGR